MTTPVRIFQGTDKTINVAHDMSDLPDATNIEVFIGKNSDIEVKKDLSDGVSGVTSTSYVVTFAAADTSSVESGEYDLQARITTASGSQLFGRLEPRSVVIIDTLFTDED